MTDELQLPELRCKRCNHIWHPYKPQRPKVCPKCKSPYWDKPYTEKGIKANETKKQKVI